MNELHLHLKVCEGCGRLWLRNIGTSGVYCQRCNTNLAQFPARRRRTGRPHKTSQVCGQKKQVLENCGGEL